MPSWMREVAGGWLVEVLVQPRASRTRVVGEHGGRLKIQLAAPPVDGEANAELVAFVAEALGVRKGAVEIERGQAGRRKTLRISGADRERLARLARGGA